MRRNLLPILSGALLFVASADAGRLPANVHWVQPVAPAAGPSASAPGGQPTYVRGQYFAYALPPRWQVGEEGPYALSLVAPDGSAFTVMVGNAGLPPNYPVDRFVYEKMMAIGPQNLQLGPPQQVVPASGFAYAYQFELRYLSQRGVVSRGVVKCHVAPAYDTALFVMTGAVAPESQWPGYATWLPRVADQIVAVDGGAFGRRGIMAQNLQLAREFGEAQRAYREWSQRTAQEVANQRDASLERRNHDVRENLGSTREYTNPYDTRVPVELPRTYQYYWVNRQGQYAGTNDPGVDMNQGSTDEWRRMPVARQ